MAGAFTAIDLSQLAVPDVVEQLDYEAILQAMIDDLRARAPEFDALVESDPAYKILEVAAYRETLIRQRVNDGAKAVMLAYAAGTDLDQIAANYSVERLLIDAGDPDAIPPVPPSYESDAELRRRVQLSPEGYTVAGSRGAYVFHALGADPDVRDAQAVSPEPGVVTVYILSRDGDGSAPAGLVDAVEAVLSSEDVRPLTDMVQVVSVSVTSYAVDAELSVLPGPDAEVVRQSAEDAVTAYVEAQHRIGYDVTLSGLFAALHRPGVHNVTLTSPAADIVLGEGETAHCSSVAVTIGGTDV